ncbi:MAG: chloride channel protein [Thermodesulfobacteriota bacterium]
MRRIDLGRIASFLRLGGRFPYMVRWSLYFVAIGIVAGCGSIVFDFLCQIGSHYFMDALAGYRPPMPTGDHNFLAPTATPLRRWMLLILPALGGLLCGIIVFSLAPESEGEGTDAAIESYHRKRGFIRARVPFVKTIASVITLTTGGSGGREGPISQIGAGFGSFLATKLKLSARDRRIMLAAGMGAGVGSIFRTPMAGALFAAEVLYRDPDIETEVILPAWVASVLAYCLFCIVMGWGTLFSSPFFDFNNPWELVSYLLLALVLAGVGGVYVRCFHKTTELFRKLPVPRFVKPAIGGLLTGAIGFFLPQTLSFGYGYIQTAIYSQATIWFLLLLAAGKILTTSFTIGSGGSGGMFGPSVVIGAALGGAAGLLLDRYVPGMAPEPGALVIVGMAGFFAGVSKTPVATIILVTEMTNSYRLLLPSLLVCTVVYLLSRRFSLYVNQPKNRVASPVHQGAFFQDILQAHRVADLMGAVRKVTLIPEQMSFADFKKFFTRTKQHYFPVTNSQGRLSGIFSSTDVREVLFEKDVEPLVVMKDIAITEIICVTPDEDLSSVMRKFTVKNIDSIPVVAAEDQGTLLGMLNRREVIRYYNQKVEEMKAQG